MRKKFSIIILSLLVILVFSSLASAHGVELKYNASTAYEITAQFDNGDPMENAQVIIYAPDDPANAWKKGKCDEKGHYSFVPDTSIKGNWTIQVRKAGHGGNINIPIGEDQKAVSGSTGYSTTQVVIMIICVVWGFIGTAFYFKRRYQ